MTFLAEQWHISPLEVKRMPYTQRRRFVNDKYLAMKKTVAGADSPAGAVGAAGARKRVR